MRRGTRAAALALAGFALLGGSGCGAVVAARPAPPALRAGAASSSAAAPASATGTRRARGRPGLRAPRAAGGAARALGLAFAALEGGPVPLAQHLHQVRYVRTTAARALAAVHAPVAGDRTFAVRTAWIVVGRAVVGPPCKCTPPRPAEVWAVVVRGVPGVRTGVGPVDLARLGRPVAVPDAALPAPGTVGA